MARKLAYFSDVSGELIPKGKRATIRAEFDDRRRGSLVVDCTVEEAERLLGQYARRVPARGRSGRVSGAES